MSLNSKGQGFQPLQEKKRMQRRQRCTCIPQQYGTDSSYKRSGSGSLGKAKAMIAGGRLCELRKFPACIPVKISLFDNDAAKCSTVSSDKLGRRMNNKIRTVPERLYQKRRCKGIIYNKGNLVFVCDMGDLLDICKRSIGISDCFDKNSFCVFLNGLFKSAVFIGIDKGGGDAGFRQSVSQKVVGSAVDPAGGNDMISCVGLVRRP